MTEAVGITCLIGALLLIAWLWRPQQAAERGVRMLLIGYAVLGGWTLWFALYAPGQEPAAFVIWKPTVIFWMLAITVIGAPLLGWGHPFKAIFGTFFAFSNRVWRWMNWGSGILFAVLGSVNLLVALMLSEGNWDGFKYSCRVLLMFIILYRLNFVWLDIVGKVVIYLYGRAKVLFP
jgi:intracellular septation protein